MVVVGLVRCSWVFPHLPFFNKRPGRGLSAFSSAVSRAAAALRVFRPPHPAPARGRDLRIRAVRSYGLWDLVDPSDPGVQIWAGLRSRRLLVQNSFCRQIRVFGRGRALTAAAIAAAGIWCSCGPENPGPRRANKRRTNRISDRCWLNRDRSFSLGLAESAPLPAGALGCRPALAGCAVMPVQAEVQCAERNERGTLTRGRRRVGSVVARDCTEAWRSRRHVSVRDCWLSGMSARPGHA